jgi:putative transposase
VVGQPRSTQRTKPRPRSQSDEELIEFLKAFALSHPRQGYKRAHRAAIEAGYKVNLKKVHRLWRQAGLKVPFKKKRKPSSQREPAVGIHQPLYPDVTWAMDFQFDETTDAKSIKILNIVDEYTRECLISLPRGSIDSQVVIAALDNLVAERKPPLYLRVDNGPEFISKALELWCEEMGTTRSAIETGSPWQNGKCESFNSRLRDELLNGELFQSITEAQVLHERYRQEYNRFRPHSSLGYLTPEEFKELVDRTYIEGGPGFGDPSAIRRQTGCLPNVVIL